MYIYSSVAMVKSSSMAKSLTLTGALVAILAVLRVWRTSDTRQSANAKVRLQPKALHRVITDEDWKVVWTLPGHETFDYTGFVDACAFFALPSRQFLPHCVRPTLARAGSSHQRPIGGWTTIATASTRLAPSVAWMRRRRREPRQHRQRHQWRGQIPTP